MSKIVWIDMEMTGLNVNTDRIMEVACIITNNDLRVLAEGPNIVIHQPDSVLNAMDKWCFDTHTKTGLFAQCQQSTTTVEEAENQLLNFLKDNGVQQSASPLAGNTVYMDRMFLRKYMPLVNVHLHYRIIDVSSVKELCKRWNPALFSRAPRKKLIHRGLDDIRESIEELQYYKQFMFTKK